MSSIKARAAKLTRRIDDLADDLEVIARRMKPPSDPWPVLSDLFLFQRNFEAMGHELRALPREIVGEACEEQDFVDCIDGLLDNLAGALAAISEAAAMRETGTPLMTGVLVALLRHLPEVLGLSVGADKHVLDAREDRRIINSYRVDHSPAPAPPPYLPPAPSPVPSPHGADNDH